jgi:hypothetical protein
MAGNAAGESEREHGARSRCGTVAPVPMSDRPGLIRPAKARFLARGCFRE